MKIILMERDGASAEFELPRATAEIRRPIIPPGPVRWFREEALSFPPVIYARYRLLGIDSEFGFAMYERVAEV